MTHSMLMHTALRSLGHHKGRSLLTILGIIIGIASIIAILAIGHGAEERVKREILSAGDNYIFIHTGNWLAEEKGKIFKRKSSPFFSTHDITALQLYIPTIKNISPITFSRQIITYHTKQINADIKAGNEKLFAILGRSVGTGIWFNQTHNHKRCRVIILGHKAAHDLFGTLQPLGQAVRIGKHNFTAIGVLKKIENRLGTSDPNTDCFVPFNTAKKHFLKINGSKVPAIAASATSSRCIQPTLKMIKKILRVRRTIKPSEPDDFTVWDQDSMLRAAQRSSDVLTLFLLIIAAISLLVGGIGVMNIMLVSVKERTKEIGIRMALGATRAMILRQFLLEALILCFIGGMLGILMGTAVPFGVSFFTGWLVIITPASLLLACCAMVIIGLAFGYYPAKTAADLNPVEALIEQ